MTNFSNLEYELMDYERKIDSSTTSNSHFAASHNSSANADRKPSFIAVNTQDLDDIFNSPSGASSSSPASAASLSNNFACVIDRNRLLKYTFKSKSSHALPQSTAVISNVNIFYELLQSMPELSKLEIK